MIDRTSNELPTSTTPGFEPDLDIAEVIQIFRRRRALFLWCFTAVLLLAVLFLLVAKRRYKAEAELELLSARSSANISDLATAGSDTSALELGITMQTYVGVLTSERLALQVIEELHLEQVPEFHFTSRESERNLSLADAPHRREEVIRRFERDLAISAGSSSKLLTVGFKATDPKTAERILKQLVGDFVAYNAGLGYGASQRTESWLGGQLGDLRAQVQKAEEAAARAQRDTGIYGTDGEHNLVLARLDALQGELINAEQNRIVKGAILHVVETGDPEAISNLSSAAGQATTPGSVNSLAFIQTLRQQEAALSGQLADLSTKFGPAYPRVAEVQRQLSDLQNSIAKETKRLTQRAHNDYRAAVDQENSLQAQVSQQKMLANQSSDAAIRYVIANREATSTRDLYERLLERSKELGVVAGLAANDVIVIDPAHVSASAVPSIPLTLLVAAAVGLVLGICVVLLWDSLDPTLYSPGMAERLSGVPLLGSIPMVTSRELRAITIAPVHGSARIDSASSTAMPMYHLASLAPNSRFAESFRYLRAMLQLSPALRSSKVLLVASALAEEGKSVVTMNLATALAQEGQHVLVVDADLRRGSLTRHLGFTAEPGLADLLKQPILAGETFGPVSLSSGVHILPSGPPQPLSAELLASSRMREAISLWKSKYDYVLLTTTPVLWSADAVTLATATNCVVMVMRDRITTKKAVLNACRLLRSVNAPLAGSVYNAITSSSSDLLGYTGQETHTA